ncbi:MAG: Fimbrial assembly protein (PilN) [Betaproteobacteria bacterium ADurb.Bin341]|nr:MAG: Fimbrial assembly protein (PilN) [Betaproteobacteria bacterium ADurb.Bin341]
MIRINLLPHREQAKKARRTQFYSLLAMVVVLGGVIVLMGYTVIQGYISNQESKNEMLRKEIASLDKDIAEINKLKEQTAALLARKNVIESLQRDRSETVYLLSELVKQVPEGIYLQSVKQAGVNINVVGYAQSNARVSTLMRNIEGSPWLERPKLGGITAKMVNNRRLNEFKLSFALKRAKVEEPAKSAAAGGKGAKK